ncbi:MAG: NAD(P)/FAD-dependent oxidoreductase [Nanoarchaeota archaeon]|nr:NAD(P)/FAD-dependent oxidoreductase [Nanoarchaeota archaeon]
MSEKSDKYDTIIIGGGIAGMTAAIYAARKRMKFEIVSTVFGGQFMVSGEIDNYPGIVKTTGVEFSDVMEKQMEFNGVGVKVETVRKVEKTGKDFKVITDKNEYVARTVIIATGSKARKLNVPGEAELSKRGVTYCSICDGPLFSDMEVAVVGGGDSALEAVDFLKEIVTKIHMIVMLDKFTGHEYLIERVKNNPKVVTYFNAETKEVLGDKFVNGLRIMHKEEEKTLDVKGVIIEIGRIPNTEAFKGFVEFDSHGHVQIDCQGHTSVPGVFSAGDCASGHEYQYIISAGQGAMALIKAAKYLATRD